MPSDTMKKLAWNGIGISLPRSWSPPEFQAFGLRAERADGPSLELSWTRVKKRFDAHNRLNALQKALGGDALVKASPEALGPDWADTDSLLAENGTETLPFSWSSDKGDKGSGIVLHSKEERIAALARFTHRADDNTAEILDILDTFSAHGPHGAVPWEAFGVSAAVPGDFELRSFSRHPGHFRLSFTKGRRGKRSELVLDRLGPADALLERKTLSQYADTFYGTLGAPAGFFDETDDGTGMVEGLVVEQRSLFSRLLRPNRYAAKRGCLWHEGIGAMLLGAFMRGPTPEALAEFESIRESYALVRS